MSVLLLRLLFFAFFLNFLVGGRRYLCDALGLGEFLATAFLLSAVFLFRHLALMLVELKFVYLTLSANLGSIEVSHLLSAHLSNPPGLLFLLKSNLLEAYLVSRAQTNSLRYIRLLDTANFAFV